ncbi:deoxynucleoside kinase [Candidatus Babeliales bacterium]|nr:deoxynucleoside kinase [Candidatus Babeliales bacterium]
MRLFLEGNIGAGKSSFLKVIERHAPEIKIAFEPCDGWLAQGRGKALLEQFYVEPTRWAYMMELVAMTTRVQAHLKDQETHTNNECRVMERSIYSGHYCFALDGKQNGFFTDVEWTAYMAWFEMLVEDCCKPPSGFIYLEVDPDICFRRVCKRGRGCETSLDVPYLARVGDWHKKFLIKKMGISKTLKNVPVLCIDGNQDFTGCEEREKALVERVCEFVARLNPNGIYSSTAYCEKSL